MHRFKIACANLMDMTYRQDRKTFDAPASMDLPVKIAIQDLQDDVSEKDVYGQSGQLPSHLGSGITLGDCRASGDEPDVVTEWQGDNDQSHPQNWARRRKWKAITLGMFFSLTHVSDTSHRLVADPKAVSAFTFLSPVASSILAPSLPDIREDLSIGSDSATSLCLTIFVLGFAFGPLVFAPLSEMYGRSIILQLSNLIFISFNTACGFSKNEAQMMAFRLLGGIGGSASLALGPAVVADLFLPEERGLAAAIYSFIPIMGPAIGPICGGFIAEYSTWRWGFWACSIASIPVLLLGALLLEETYQPVLLQRKQLAHNKSTENEQTLRCFLGQIGDAMIRPLRLLCTQPIIIIMGLYQAYLYGLMYIVLTTYPNMWQERYKESISIGGLNYISLGLGYCGGIQVCSTKFILSVSWFANYEHSYLATPKTPSTAISRGAATVSASLSSAYHCLSRSLLLCCLLASCSMVGASRGQCIGLCQISEPSYSQPAS